MRHWYVCYFVLLFFLHGCGKKQLSQYDKIAHKKVPVLAQFDAEVEGIECALCALDVVDIFKSVDGASMVDFVMTGTSHEQGYIHFCYDMRKNNLDLQKVDDAVIEEGFLLQSLKGVFNLKPVQRQGKHFVIYNDDLELSLLVPNTTNIEKLINLNNNEAQFVKGKILRQSDSTFSFMPEDPAVKR